MGGRVVEGTGLENRQARKGLVGSNPTPSASDILTSTSVVRRAYHRDGSPQQDYRSADRADCPKQNLHFPPIKQRDRRFDAESASRVQSRLTELEEERPNGPIAATLCRC